MSGNARDPGRSTIDRLFTLLGVLGDGELTLAEIAQRSGLPLTTAHRILAAAEAWGGVERDPSGTYRIGLRLWELSNRSAAPAPLREIALPVLQDLYEATRASVHLVVLDRDSALVVERVAGLRSVATRAEVGERLPLHATAVGKVLLAHSSPALLAELGSRGLRRHTPHTVVMPGRLAASVRAARDVGVATAHEEFALGAASIAAAVTGCDGSLRAAVGVVTYSHVTLTRYEAALRSATDRISRRLAAREDLPVLLRQPG
ncbi:MULTISPECIES: IclR family transcriptional regulator [unclassified Amycolatopsis]|uniref:IclR family transcriptional regulator n=1 Tax=unclassified Amycolatopsis TaxID=2618356 RepID=UPI001C69E985|nr:IclR family transcriptional regulator [Amycolatopsis sp. DSM 110486]QYN18795.1 IclR family transcriptional regulator [Amycolatopsis sp. DSM 110486]